MKDTTALTLAEITEFRRREKLRGLSDVDVVKAWYQADDADTWELTPRQHAMRERWDFAKAQFLARKKYADACQAIVDEFGVGIATARRDIAQAMSLFGDLDKVPREAHRARAIDMALETFEVAKKANDAAGMAKATASYIVAAGVDRDDAEQIDIEKLMRERTYVEVLDPQLRDLLLNFLQQSGGSVDVTKLFEKIYAAKNADYVNYEAIPHDAGTDPRRDQPAA